MKLAGAPISWGVCEVPGWGAVLPPHDVLADMSELGLRATELGPPDYLPTDPTTCATSSSRSAPSPAASGSVWRGERG
jgi:hypothetical protein